MLLSFLAYTQPATDWTPFKTTGGTGVSFSVSNISISGNISGGDIVGLFVVKGGTLYFLGQTTITHFGGTATGFASFSSSTTTTGSVVIAGDDIAYIKIYDNDGVSGYYDIALSPVPKVPASGVFGSYSAAGKSISPAAALPVELTSFTGAFSNNAVTLNWATASEENNDYFTVERSNNGKTFDALDNISGAGTTVEAQEYTYTDEKPESGVNYYRIKQTDFDEKFTYSKVIAVETNKEELEIKIYPNPVSSVANIVLPAFDGDTKISVMDVSGREVLSQQVSDINEEAIQLDLSQLQSGLYIITVTNGSQVISKQIQLTK